MIIYINLLSYHTMTVQVHLIRYGDYQAYMHLIQYISTRGSVTQEDFRKFACTDKEFILVVADESGHLFMTAKMNYLFRFSKQMVYDMLVQDLIYDPNCTLSIQEGYEALFQYCRAHEETLGLHIGRRMISMNHFLFAHELLLKKYEMEFV
jgi:hypothetical protein